MPRPTIKVDISSVGAEKGAQKIRKELDSLIKKTRSLEAATEKSAKAATASMIKRSRAINSARQQFLNFRQAVKNSGGDAQLITRTANSFYALERAMKKGTITSKEFAAAQDRFRSSLGNAKRSLSAFKTTLKATEIKKASRDTQHLKRSMTELNKSVQIALGPLSGLSSRLTAFSALITATNIKLALFSVGIIGLGVGIVKSLKAFTSYEQNIAKIKGLLSITGNAAELTAKQIDVFAQKLGYATLTNRTEVLKAAAALLTFKSISGDAFKTTLKLAEDLSEIFGTSLIQSTVQLAKALQDPATQLSNLRRSGISFTDAQRDMIVSMSKTGKAAEAQAEIFKILNGQLSKAAKSAATNTLAGAFDSLTESIINLGIAVSQTFGVGRGATGMLSGIASWIQNLTELLGVMQGIEAAIAKFERRGFLKNFFKSPKIPEQKENLPSSTKSPSFFYTKADKKLFKKLIKELSKESLRDIRSAAKLEKFYKAKRKNAEVVSKAVARLTKRFTQTGSRILKIPAPAKILQFRKEYDAAVKSVQAINPILIDQKGIIDKLSTAFIRLASAIANEERVKKEKIKKHELTNLENQLSLAQELHKTALASNTTFMVETLLRKELNKLRLKGIELSIAEIEQRRAIIQKTVELNESTIRQRQAVSSLTNAFANFARSSILHLDSVRGAAKQLVDAIQEIIFNLTVIEPLKKNASGIFSSIVGAVGGMFGGGSSTALSFAEHKPFASGGRPPLGRPSLVGEKGRELFTPDVPGTIFSNATTERLLQGGKAPIIINQQFDFKGASLEAVALLQNNADKIKTETIAAIERRQVRGYNAKGR